MAAASGDQATPRRGHTVDRRLQAGRQGPGGRQHRAAWGDVAGGDGVGQIVTHQTGQMHRAVDVEQASALLHQAGTGDRLGAVLQHGLDQRRRQARVGVQHQCDGARHHRRRHRGARQVLQCLVGRLRRAAQPIDQRRVVGGQRVQRGAQRGGRTQHLVARRHQVGLEQVVGAAHTQRVDKAAPGGPARAEAVDDIVCAGHAGFEIGRAHGDHRGVVARRRNGAKGLDAVSVFAKVAASHDHRDARSSGRPNGAAQRVGDEGLGGIGRQADVEHADVVFLGVVQHPVDAGQGVGQLALAAAVEHLDVIDQRAGGNAAALHPAAVAGTAGGDAGNVGAVPVGVLALAGVVVDF